MMVKLVWARICKVIVACSVVLLTANIACGNDQIVSQDACIGIIVNNIEQLDQLPDFLDPTARPQANHVFLLIEMTVQEIKCEYIFFQELQDFFILNDTNLKSYAYFDWFVQGLASENPNDIRSPKALIKGSLIYVVFEIPLNTIPTSLEYTYPFGSSWDEYYDPNIATIHVQLSATIEDCENLIENFEGQFKVVSDYGSIPSRWSAGGPKNAEFAKATDSHHGLYSLHANITYHPEDYTFLETKLKGTPGSTISLKIKVKAMVTSGSASAGLWVSHASGVTEQTRYWYSYGSPTEWQSLELNNIIVPSDGELPITIYLGHDTPQGSTDFYFDCLTSDDNNLAISISETAPVSSGDGVSGGSGGGGGCFIITAAAR